MPNMNSDLLIVDTIKKKKKLLCMMHILSSSQLVKYKNEKLTRTQKKSSKLWETTVRKRRINIPTIVDRHDTIIAAKTKRRRTWKKRRKRKRVIWERGGQKDEGIWVLGMNRSLRAQESQMFATLKQREQQFGGSKAFVMKEKEEELTSQRRWELEREIERGSEENEYFWFLIIFKIN